MAAARSVSAVSAGRGSKQTRREQFGHLAPLSMAALVAAEAAFAAISLTTDEPLYELFVHVLIMLGITLSFIGSLINRRFGFLGSALMVLGFFAYAIRQQQHVAGIPFFYPPEVIGDEETSLSALCAWFLVGFCFMQSQRENLVFIFVPGLSIFALMATRNLNPELLVAFMVFLAASVYCWGYDHFLRAAEQTRRRLNWRQWARAHLSGAALVFILAGLGGLVIGNALYYTTPRMYAGFGFRPRVWNYAGAHIQGYFRFRSGFQLGAGPIRLSPEVVLKVRAQRPHLWRGRSYDRYDGRGWERSSPFTYPVKKASDGSFLVRETVPRRPEAPVAADMPYGGMRRGPGAPPMAPGPGGMGGPPMAPGPGGMGAPPMAPGPGGMGGQFRPGPEVEVAQPPSIKLAPLRGRDFHQQFIVVGSTTDAIFGAPYINAVKFGPSVSIMDPLRGGLRTDRYGSVQPGSMMSPGQTYSVVSKLPDLTPKRLRAAPAGKYSADFRERYIDQGSLEVAAKLGPLVERLTAGATNNYDKAIAIQRYIERRCLYTLNVPYTPRGKDRVVYFVMSSQRGACDLFASSMTLMCRLAGIPARVATGFNQGTWDRDEGAFIVRGTDAHAWSEVYFPGHGWVPFDLVAERSLEGESWASLLRLGQWRLALSKAMRGALWLVVTFFGLYLMAAALVDPRYYVRAFVRRWLRRRRPHELLALEYEGLMRALARRADLRRWRAKTPWELLGLAADAAFLSANLPLRGQLQRVTADFYDLRYDRERPAERVARARHDIKRVRKLLRRSRHRRRRHD